MNTTLSKIILVSASAIFLANQTVLAMQDENESQVIFSGRKKKDSEPSPIDSEGIFAKSQRSEQIKYDELTRQSESNVSRNQEGLKKTLIPEELSEIAPPTEEEIMSQWNNNNANPQTIRGGIPLQDWKIEISCKGSSFYNLRSFPNAGENLRVFGSVEAPGFHLPFNKWSLKLIVETPITFNSLAHATLSLEFADKQFTEFLQTHVSWSYHQWGQQQESLWFWSSYEKKYKKYVHNSSLAQQARFRH